MKLHSSKAKNIPQGNAKDLAAAKLNMKQQTKTTVTQVGGNQQWTSYIKALFLYPTMQCFDVLSWKSWLSSL